MLSIYHNPRCSKSRQTLTLLQEQGLTPEIIKYLDTPPTPAELSEVINKLKIRPRELLRTQEADYKTLKLTDSSLSDTQLISAMCRHPKLIERPIVINGNRARLGRPPEQVLEIIG
ncbi:arsenate reductase (glutaredoxin) [uncultured Gilvimarinus sp.]|uniref:arsenate reductase (glutaredoxin) n=1 Tax=uncultured Gilvimarinus sp. TaxID=1689143 RepID=UPI0030EB4740|tara:strand:+ start:1705 stop:2052 length:348 start_codon:yes stop_codon:yes gene_type:complete